MNRVARSDFVPSAFDPSDLAQIEPLGQELLERRLPTLESLRRWVADACALFEVLDEYGSLRYIDSARHTDDPDVEKAFLHYVREIEPRLQPLLDRLKRRYLANPQRHDLYEASYAMLERQWQADVDIYRDENVPLHTRCTELANEYGKISGAMTVAFRDGTYTLQQLARFLEETDRTTRRQAWVAAAERRLQDRSRMEQIFEELLQTRQQIARNAGFDDYRQYAWIAKKRFDYRPEQCLAFADAIRQVCLPWAVRLDRQQLERLGLETLRPWDTSVDPYNRPPLRPFPEEDIDGFVERIGRIFDRIDGELAEQFRSLGAHGDLDLESRKGKRPGGFQAALEASRRPFIFMNAAGVQRDVDTLLHEAGHAFHYLASAHQPNYFVRHAPLEFCEVASMAMELLGCDHYDVFYDDPAEAARAKRQQLEGVVRRLLWIAVIDGFQHWLYTHPGHSGEQRAQAWEELLARYSSGVVDWSGQEEVRRWIWQRQMHLFHAPFYYIEYGIAQLGALQVWVTYRQDPPAALRRLRDAFALGGTRPLPELFQTAGIRLAFDEATLRPLIEAVGRELDELPA